MSPTATPRSCDVVIPARNAEPYLAAAIASVLAQSLPASRIIIVDDRSIDGTAAVAAAFGNRIRIVVGEGRTAAAARNLGARHSSAELLAFADADDVCHRERLMGQVEALLGRPDSTMVFCDAAYTFGSGEPTGAVFGCPDFNGDAFLGQLFERNRILSTSVAMVRRASFDAVGGFDERLSHAEDYDLWLRLGGSGRIEHLAEPLVSYRVHAGNLSNDREALRRCEIEILKKHPIDRIRCALLDTHGQAARADLELSRVLFRMERFTEGEALARAVWPDAPDRALHHFTLGNFAIARDDLETAAAEHHRCLACDATFAPSHNNLGVIAATEGRRRAAHEHFGAAVRLRPDYSDPRHNIDALQQGRRSGLRYTYAPLRSVLRPSVGIRDGGLGRRA